MDSNFILPDYKNSLLNVPHTVLSYFGSQTFKPALSKEIWQNIEGSKNLVLFLIDGLGFNIFEKIACNQYFFKVFSQKGKVSKITSVFPATTAAALTTLHSGLAPIEHGFFEWNLYFPVVGEIIESLPYKIVHTKFTDPDIELPQDFSLIFNGKTIYERLKENKVESVIFLPEEISGSSYTKATSKGATIVSYKDLPDLLRSLINTLERSNTKRFCYVYWYILDEAEHAYGVWSNEVKKEVEKLSKYLDEEFLKKLTKKTALETGIFFTGDHGQEDIDLENLTLLNNYNFLTDNYQKNSKGNPILPSGSPRDIFLHIKEDRVNEVIAFLSKELEDKSIILKLDDKTIETLFGDFIPHKEFLERLGNILILSKGSHVCLYKYNIEKKLVLKAHHGSLSESEMIIPFGCARASSLM